MCVLIGRISITFECSIKEELFWSGTIIFIRLDALSSTVLARESISFVSPGFVLGWYLIKQGSNKEQLVVSPETDEKILHKHRKRHVSSLYSNMEGISLEQQKTLCSILCSFWHRGWCEIFDQVLEHVPKLARFLLLFISLSKIQGVNQGEK